MFWRFMLVILEFVFIVSLIPLKLKLKFRQPSIFVEGMKQEFVIDQFKPLLVKLLCLLDDILPEPTISYMTRGRDIEILIEVRDDYLEHEQLEWVRKKALRALLNYGIILLERNSCYVQRAGYIHKGLIKRGWNPGTPARNWR